MSDRKNTAPRIAVTTTPYEGEQFPEAPHYPEYVAGRLAEMFPGHQVDVSEGPRSAALVYGSDVDADEVKTLVEVDLWDDFCADGYRAYSQVGV